MDWVFRRYFTRDLYQPHTWWGFDGPYTRMQMEDGSSFIMIMSSVWRAKTRPHLCHISYSPLPGMSTKSSTSNKNSSETYTSSTSNEVEAFLCDFYPDAMDARRRKRDDSHQHAVAAYTLSAKFPEQDASFTLKVDGGAQSYTHKFTHPETRQKLDLEVRISNNTPHSLLGPMWIGRFLPIPLKWHIFSTRSQTIITIRDREAGGRVLMEKKGLAHQEKNWGIGFPSAWIWCQAFPTPSTKGSLAIAGGALTSFLQSFMIAYRSPTSTRNWDFGPATSMRLFGIGPFVSLSKCSSKEGEVVLDCTNPFRGQRISIRGKADPATFQQMSAPLPRGHTPEYCHETFQATYDVKLFERQGWFGQYKLVEETTMDNSALEFGGDWSHWWTERKRE